MFVKYYESHAKYIEEVIGGIIPSPYGSYSVGMKRPWSYTLSSYVQCALPPFAICTSTIKLGANGRNIVG